MANKSFCFGVSAALFFAATQPAQAYVDPGTGAMLLQLLLGGVAGLMVIIKLYWARLKEFFRRKPSPSSDVDSQ